MIHTIPRLLKTMSLITMTGEDNHIMSTFLQSHRSVNHQPFGATDT